MYALRYVSPTLRPRVSPVNPAMVARALFALLAFGLLTLPVLAEGPAQRLRLRGDVTARGDVLTLGDLVEGASADLSVRPLFRAPSLGGHGTIQARRIAEAVAALGLGEIETGGRVQVAVQRAARRVAQPEIEAALKRSLETAYGLDGRTVAIRLDGDAPVLLAPVDLDGQASAVDLTYDPRSRRLAALVTLGDRQASLRVTGLVMEIREVVVIGRQLNRGEAVTPADFTVERRPKEAVPTDARTGAADLPGQVAQRGLSAGAILRGGDVAPPDLVARGEAVTIVFDAPGLALSLRGQANESGRLGAAITVTNPVSKKVLPATVIGPGRVSVGPAPAPIQRQANAALDGTR
ncbi:flagellar biosynthesis protein FlgA [Methylobacterium sp. Leaf469]|uniref:flagellar basal body P-ring formation chaperone FlgA n=1 Tax=unclassified Methylobacterium TaxID=2615210 RepID=UPI0006F8A418|nr:MULTISPECIES: flagellar basal body P-ring formation chaperone FlgA [unclassified Methylobacterium]KQO69069.1 flagellar biosynthesis protein FlgA [Methylobacterium sp. Leaf87]KQP30702.1 flagellar biosynthesis protein FlgA [Methylobacterium sp. Leaf102]KQT98800.1 flagellar biosynthesis protein FlgA [Methylobacterium sp. Leaf469]USU32834.1 flagellar basal body P-ring formation chaperone FlgA [Methylobacterium sp. OTU13CASTA1]